MDYGTVRVGLALGYLHSGLVVALPHLERGTEAGPIAERLAEVARAHGAGRIVLGHPLHADGRPGTLATEIARIGEALERLGFPIALQDERYTSLEAEALLRAHGRRWWQVAKGQIDALAAMTITRDYLHRLNPSLALLPDEPPPEPHRAPRRADRRRRARREQRGRRGEQGEEG